jgi:integrase
MASNVVRFPKPAPVQKPKKTKKAKGLMPDGRYRAMCDLGKRPDGSRNRIPFYGASYKAAKEAADKHKAAHKEGQDLAAAKQTVGTWAETWLKTYGSGAGYSTNYSNALYVKQLLETDLGKMKLSDVRDVHVQMFANALSGRSKSAVMKIRSIVQRVFIKAVANRMISFDPTAAIRWPNAGEGSHRALDDSEVRLIIDHWQDSRAGLWAMFMLFAGLRRGEVLALRWADVDCDAGVIHIGRGVHFERNRPVYGAPKTKAGFRDVPMLPPLRRALAGLYGPPRSPDVCTGAEGNRATMHVFTNAWTVWQNALRRAAKDDTLTIRAHDLRHTFCTMLYDAGVDLKTAQTLMGHNDAAMTMELYTHLTKTRKAQALDGLEKWCSKWCSDPEET